MGSNVPPMTPRRVPTRPILRPGPAPIRPERRSGALQPRQQVPAVVARSGRARIPRTIPRRRGSARSRRARTTPGASASERRGSSAFTVGTSSPFEISNHARFMRVGLDPRRRRTCPIRIRSSARRFRAPRGDVEHHVLRRPPSAVTAGSSNRSGGIDVEGARAARSTPISSSASSRSASASIPAPPASAGVVRDELEDPVADRDLVARVARRARPSDARPPRGSAASGTSRAGPRRRDPSRAADVRRSVPSPASRTLARPR